MKIPQRVTAVLLTIFLTVTPSLLAASLEERVVSKTATSILEVSAQQSAAIVLWFDQNQNRGTSGLIASYQENPEFIYHTDIHGVLQKADWAKIYANTQAFTYDQALAGIVFLKQGKMDAAKKIFDFYYSQWQEERENFSGFWTVYSADPSPPLRWKKYEWRKGMGENVWMALFCLQYEKAVTDATEKTNSLDLAIAIGKWVSTLNHHEEGAVAMSPFNSSSETDFSKIYSVENNLDYYALLKALSVKAPAADLEYFTKEFSNLKNWLKTN